MAMSGARRGRMTGLRRLAAGALARDLTAFVVPGPEIARAHGLDLTAAGLRPVPTPRHAGVLLIIGDLPTGLARAAAVAYAQMPRPRAILAVGAGRLAPLPAPDIAVPLAQDALERGIGALRRRIADGAFSPTAPAFAAAAVRTTTEYTCPMHPEIVRAAPGSCPICGMALVPRQSVGEVMGPGVPDHDQAQDTATGDGGEGGTDVGAYACPMHPEVVRDQPGKCPICGMDLIPRAAAAGGSAAADPTGGHGGAMDARHAAHQHHRADMVGAAHGEHGDAGIGERGSHAGMDHGGGDHAATRRASEAASGTDHGAMPGMAHGAHVGMAGMAHHQLDHGGHDTADRGGGGQDMPGMAHGAHNMGTVDQGQHDMANMGHDLHGMGDRGRGGHDMGDMGDMDHGMHMQGGFMSMVAMTRDLPRSRDGLPMEWLEVPFGPLFPGLPGGLDLVLTLDGDVVARASLPAGVVGRGLAATFPGPAATFPDRLARLDPLAPVAYRLLAWRALDSAAGATVDERTARGRIGALERERAVSHLGWLASFAALLGDRWLAERAAAAQLALVRAADPATLAWLREDVRRLVDRTARDPFLRRRLRGIGRVAGVATVERRGPVARAGGVADDARASDPAYLALGFAPVVRTGDDALARLHARLAELAQSLDLVRAAGTVSPVGCDAARIGGGSPGLATIETPRGAATLRLLLDGGTVREVHLDTPSTAHGDLIPAVAAGRELADALVGVASLDLSPWERDR